MDKYAAPTAVEWHFAGVLNRWTRRTLAVAGFGYPAADKLEELGNWCPAYTVASSLAGATDNDARQAKERDSGGRDEEKRSADVTVSGNEGDSIAAKAEDETSEKSECTNGNGVVGAGDPRLAPVHGVDRPFFHIDLVDAVDAAVRDARRKDERGVVEPRSSPAE